MSTANVARDLDVLRAAVGDQKLTYAGYSYGSYLGNKYANLSPVGCRTRRRARSDRLVDRPEPPRGRTVPFSTRLHSDEGAQATLNEFFRLCDTNDLRSRDSCHPTTCAAKRRKRSQRPLPTSSQEVAISSR
jgi:pimeloyl-ACP methyl ester carboxylesterase